MSSSERPQGYRIQSCLTIGAGPAGARKRAGPSPAIFQCTPLSPHQKWIRCLEYRRRCLLFSSKTILLSRFSGQCGIWMTSVQPCNWHASWSFDCLHRLSYVRTASPRKESTRPSKIGRCGHGDPGTSSHFGSSSIECFPRMKSRRSKVVGGFPHPGGAQLPFAAAVRCFMRRKQRPYKRHKQVRIGVSIRIVITVS